MTSHHDLAVSSIAWLPNEWDQAMDVLESAGVGGLEVAPTTVWPDPMSIDRPAARQFADRAAAHGLRLVAFQALLFGRPELRLFGDADARRALLEHLTGMCRLAAHLDVPVLVFGSPRNRATGGRDRAEVRAIGHDFFLAIANVAHDLGTALCIEPNPASYGTDFVTSLAEARELVLDVDHPGFGLHLDAGALVLEGPTVAPILRDSAEIARHMHMSEPSLVPFGSTGLDHGWIAATLVEGGYTGWRSLEMTADPAGDNMPRLARSIEAARAAYG
jgi:sugar phosphate isomerase/epimerase